MEQAGILVVEGVDIDLACKFAYETNTRARFVHRNVRDYTKVHLNKAWDENAIKVLVGCTPCQPFSSYTQGPRGNHRIKWVLLNKFADLITEAKPDIVSMENVTSLSLTATFKKFVRNLKKNGYWVSYSVVDCREYGIPQMRRRLVLLASRHASIEINAPTHPKKEQWLSVKSAIGKLPPLSAGHYLKSDPLHCASELSPINMKRIKASKPGGSWRDWPDELIAKCHKKASGKTYPGVYGRMTWDDPSPTITGQCFGFGNGRFGHPEQDRALSLREAAILQTFPKKYAFFPKDELPKVKIAGRMIGNSVPPLLGKVIGETIKNHAKVYIA